MAAQATDIENLIFNFFTTLFTDYATYMDNMCARDTSLVAKFVDNFIYKKPQGHPVLDAYANLLLDMPNTFQEVVSNLMITSSLNLITAWLLEAEAPHMSVSCHSRIT